MNKLEIIDYWDKYLNGIPNDVVINFQDYFCENAEYISLELSVDILSEINSFCSNQDIDNDMFLISCFLISMALLSGKNAVGAMVCRDEITLPVFIDIFEHDGIKSLAHNLKANIAEAFEHSMSFSQITKFIGEDGVIYNENNYIHICLDKNKMENYSTVCFDSNNKCIFNCYVLKKSHLEALINVFKDICMYFCKNPMSSLKEIDFSKIDYYKRIINYSSGEVKSMPDEINLGSMFKKAVEMYPDSPVIISKNKVISYSVFYNAVLNMSEFLLKTGVDKNCRCIVLCRQDIDTIVLLISLIYIGAVIVPLDKNYPPQKLEVTKSNIGSKFVFSSVENPKIDNLINVKTDFSEHSRDIEPVLNDDMYVTFTSGTTGVPKSIKITCRDFYNLHCWYCDVFGLSHDDRNLLLTNFGFDAAIKNFISPLLCGAAIVLVGDELFNIKEIVRMIDFSRATHINCVPSLFEKLLTYSSESNYEQLSCVKVVALGGEKFPKDIAKDWAKSPNFNASLMNVYGPAEATDLSAYYILDYKDITESDVIPLGKPLYNKNLYVFDENMYLCPCNEKGELYISGTGVICSYLNKKDNVKKFIKHIGLPNQQLYRTGDIVYRDDHGNLIYSGRIDNQIKYNGQRIELEDLESVIEKHKSVSKCMVKIYKQSEKSDRLVAYCVINKKDGLNNNELYNHCIKWINSSMIPSKFIQVDDIPLTVNGKLDRTWEPEIKIETSNALNENFSKTESKVADIWKKILTADHIGKDTPFFEAGGSSLLLPQLQKELENEFDIDISVVDLLELTTISKIAKFIDEGV